MIDWDDDVMKMGVKSLNALITTHGLSTTDCGTRSDLRKRAQEALVRVWSHALHPAAPFPSDTSSSVAKVLFYSICLTSCIFSLPTSLQYGSSLYKSVRMHVCMCMYVSTHFYLYVLCVFV